jgi:hypothetical protein
VKVCGIWGKFELFFFVFFLIFEIGKRLGSRGAETVKRGSDGLMVWGGDDDRDRKDQAHKGEGTGLV